MPKQSITNTDVRLRLTITKEQYKNVRDFMKDNGLASEQDVIRMAVTRFFNNNGELLHNNKKQKTNV